MADPLKDLMFRPPANPVTPTLEQLMSGARTAGNIGYEAVVQPIIDVAGMVSQGVTPEGVFGAMGLLSPMKAQAAGKAAERIGAAALSIDGRAFVGPNHVWAHDAARNAGIDGVRLVKEAKQGFLTTDGRFVDRREAERIAHSVDQTAAQEWGLPKGQISGRGVTSEGLAKPDKDFQRRFIEEWQGRLLK